MQCWGAKESGQHGDGTFVGKSAPSTPSDLGAGAIAVAIAPAGNHTCAALG